MTTCPLWDDFRDYIIFQVVPSNRLMLAVAVTGLRKLMPAVAVTGLFAIMQSIVCLCTIPCWGNSIFRGASHYRTELLTEESSSRCKGLDRKHVLLIM